jgi:hypothetical protein
VLTRLSAENRVYRAEKSCASAGLSRLPVRPRGIPKARLVTFARCSEFSEAVQSPEPASAGDRRAVAAGVQVGSGSKNGFRLLSMRVWEVGSGARTSSPTSDLRPPTPDPRPPTPDPPLPTPHPGIVNTTRAVKAE